jgi:hypothetical protein
MLRLSSFRRLVRPGMPVPKRVVLHYHIFKNAGTTIESTLAENFGSGFRRFDANGPFVILTETDLCDWLAAHPSLQALSSHNLIPPKPNITGVEFYDLVLLRHPVDRLMSMYEYYRRARDASDPLSGAAGKLDPAGFFCLLMEKYPHLINNAQVNYLNGGKKIPREPDLQRAVRILRRFFVFGVTEEFDIFMVSAEDSLQPLFGRLDFSYVPQNVAHSRAPELAVRLDNIRQSCGIQLYDRLVKLNKLDLELIEIAGEEARHRFEQVANCRQRLMDFKTRCDRRAGKAACVD